MSANPNNAGLELIDKSASQATTPVPASATPGTTQSRISGQEALQALLAFSSLHEQIRRRRAREIRNGGHVSEDAGRLEQFVLDEALHLVAERALTITRADGVAIALAEGDAILCRASAGNIAPDPGVRLDLNSGFSGACLVSGRTVRCDDSETDPRVDPSACRRLGARSMVAVPLSAKQAVIGLLEAFSSQPYGFNEGDVQTLNLLAELILSAMRPEEEDRLSEISQRVVSQAATAGDEPLFASQPPKTQASDPRSDSSFVTAESARETGQGIARDRSATSLDYAQYSNVQHPQVQPSHIQHPDAKPGLKVVIAVVMIAFVLGAGMWWSVHRHTATVQPQTVAPAVSSTNRSASPPAEPADGIDSDSDSANASAPTAHGVLPQVTGIRHWSSTDSSTVVIDLQDQVQYEAHRLANPERIYFDLHDTKLGPDLSSKTIPVDDGLLQRVRVAQPTPGVTRVVLETHDASNFSVSLEPNPYRLVVEVRRVGAKPQPRSKIDLFNSPSDASTTNQSATNEALFGPSNPKPENPLANSEQSGKPRVLASGPKLRIVLDAGHGGWDLGTVGRKGLLEKDLVLDIVERLGNLIEKRLPVEVIYTRKDDSYIALEKRAEIANLSQAGLFLSVHANYSDFPSARGIETYYSNTYSSVRARTRETDEAESGLQNVNWTNVDIREKVHESRRLAASVQHALYGMLAPKNPGLPNRGVKEAQYVVLTGTSMPAILAEVSFVSSPTDENNLQSSRYRQQIAEALYQGVAHYAEESSRVKMASNQGKTAAR